MSRTTIDFGVDLGTTNSAIALSRNGAPQVLRNADGTDVTPSVVRVAKDGSIVVGRRAKQMLELDSSNTRAEFKRLMGTTERWSMPASGQEMGPEELSAEVLKSLRADARDLLGEEVTAAVVTVPALFEIPQCEATVRAARLAGLKAAPLLQEPIAAAIASGYRTGAEVDGFWLVYDLGGGTFDTSLLMTRGGRMEVVDHDGDNFLGGKDFDWLIVDWAAEELRRAQGWTDFDRSNDDPAVRRSFAKLKAAAEETKILLSRSDRALLQVDDLLRGVDCDLSLTRAHYERLIESRVARTVQIVDGLLERNRVERGALEKLIFVGGPTLTPALRAAVEGALKLGAERDVDPMTVVATGAALFAATQEAPAKAKGIAVDAGARAIQLEYPPISQDPEPFLVGRVPGSDEPRAASVEVDAADGSFRSGRVPLSDKGGFALSLRLRSRTTTTFTVRLYDEAGNTIAAEPSEIVITHGNVVSEPPLSRSIGVATADNVTRFFLSKGTTLPARRTFPLTTVEAVRPGDDEAVIKVPVVQGESQRADRNRLVGSLEISAGGLKRALPPHTEIEVTIEIDGSGSLRAQAYVPLADQLFEEVISLRTPRADPDVLSKSLWRERSRLMQVRKNVSEIGLSDVLPRTQEADERVAELESLLSAARGDDPDAAQQATRRLLELQMLLDEIEALLQWPQLERDLEIALGRARMTVIREGDKLERQQLEQLEKDAEEAREKRDPQTMEWKAHELHALAWAIESRNPQAWLFEFEHLASQPTAFTNPTQAHGLLETGRAIRNSGRLDALPEVVRSLWKLLPPDAAARGRSFGSGVR